MKLITFVSNRNTTYTMYFTGDHYLAKYPIDGVYFYRLCRYDSRHGDYELTEKQYNEICEILKGEK
jgi:hypothetical protein